jgi:hypothetical protein
VTWLTLKRGFKVYASQHAVLPRAMTSGILISAGFLAPLTVAEGDHVLAQDTATGVPPSRVVRRN